MAEPMQVNKRNRANLERVQVEKKNQFLAFDKIKSDPIDIR